MSNEITYSDERDVNRVYDAVRELSMGDNVDIFVRGNSKKTSNLGEAIVREFGKNVDVVPFRDNFGLKVKRGAA